MKPSREKSTPRNNDQQSYLKKIDKILPPLTKRQFRNYAVLVILINTVITVLLILVLTYSRTGKALMAGQNPFAAPTALVAQGEPATATQSPVVPDTPTPTIPQPTTPPPPPTMPPPTIASIQECSTLRNPRSFYSLDFNTQYSVFPKDACIHLILTDTPVRPVEIQTTSGTPISVKYQEARVWIWVKTESILNVNGQLVINEGKLEIYLEKPSTGSIPVDFNIPVNLPIEITNNTDSGYTEIIVDGWIDGQAIILPTPTP
jgi:hypothetical protein